LGEADRPGDVRDGDRGARGRGGCGDAGAGAAGYAHRSIDRAARGVAAGAADVCTFSQCDDDGFGFQTTNIRGYDAETRGTWREPLALTWNCCTAHSPVKSSVRSSTCTMSSGTGLPSWSIIVPCLSHSPSAESGLKPNAFSRSNFMDRESAITGQT